MKVLFSCPLKCDFIRKQIIQKLYQIFLTFAFDKVYYCGIISRSVITR